MSALDLRFLACICMLLDHIGFVWGISVLRTIGRLAFPIFVFLIYNGWRHTSDRRRYAVRLGIFALISQIPYCLLSGREDYLQKGNVFVTLLTAMLCLWAVDTMLRQKKLRYFCWLPPFVLFVCYHYGWLRSDYGIKGVLFALLFYFAERRTWKGKLLTVLGMLPIINIEFLTELAISIIKGVLSGDWNWPGMSSWGLQQHWSLLAALPIFLYNGEKSRSGRYPGWMQYGFYLFYPAHQIILWAIQKWMG